MRIVIAVAILASVLQACGPTLSTQQQLREAATEAQQFKQDGQIFLESLNSIDGCPAGTTPTDTEIGVNTGGDIQNDNGTVFYYMGGRSARNNSCIRQ